jgi:tRNA(Ile)-lysidine synthase
VTRSFDWIRFSRPDSRLSGYQMPVTVPGSVVLPVGGSRLEFSISAYEEGEGALDWERIPGPLAIRNWRAGDCYRPAGWARPVKIKELFQKNRIPVWVRPAWPVLTGGDSILWVRKFGPAADYIAGPETRRALKVHVHQQLADFEESETDLLTS